MTMQTRLFGKYEKCLSHPNGYYNPDEQVSNLPSLVVLHFMLAGSTVIIFIFIILLFKILIHVYCA